MNNIATDGVLTTMRKYKYHVNIAIQERGRLVWKKATKGWMGWQALRGLIIA